RHKVGGHTASSPATERTAAATSMADASFRTYPTTPSWMARRKVSGSASMPIITTLRPGTAPRTSGISCKSESATAVESDSSTSGAAAEICSTTWGENADAPTTRMSLFLLRSRVRASRSSRFSANMKTQILSVATAIVLPALNHAPPQDPVLIVQKRIHFFEFVTENNKNFISKAEQ